MLISSISDTFISIGIWIVSGIYKIASWAFEVFLILSTGQIIDSEKYTVLINNFYIVLGIILLFFLAFSLLRGMVNPDDQKQGTSTIKKIVINLITSAVLMALLPTIFGLLYDFQTSFITKYNVIGRFFGYGSLDNTSGNYSENTNTAAVEQGAFQIVNGVYTAFFNVNEDVCEEEIHSAEDLFNCQNGIYAEDSFWFIKWRNSNSFAAAIQSVNETGKFNTYNDFSKNVDDGELDFQFLLSLIAGLFLIYIAVSFCFDMALRMVKLVFYQIIAPIPIFGRVIPEGPLSKSFDQWVKATLACYFEVYTRIFVFYFVVYFCMAMLESDFINNQLYEFSPIIGLLGKAFLLMGIVMFMKQAPKLISEVTGIKSDGMKLGIKDKLKDGGFFTAGAAVGAGATALTRNATSAFKNIKNKWGESNSIRDRAKLIASGIGSTIAGGASGTVRGAKAGWKAGSFSDMSSAAGKGAKAAVDARDKRAAYRASHPNGTIIGHFSDAIDTVSRWAGFNNIQELKEANQMIDNVSGKVDKVVDNSKEIIRSQLLAKGKNFGFNVSGNDSKYGISFDANTYRKISDLKDRATTSGEAQDLSGVVSDIEAYNHAIANARRMAQSMGIEFKAQDFAFDEDNNPLDLSEQIKRIESRFTNSSKYNADEIQRIFGKYENDYAKEVANSAFLSNENYEKYIYATNADGSFILDANGNRQRNITLEEEAAMTSARSAAVDARYELGRHIGSSLIQESNANITPTRNDGTPNVILDNSTINGDLKVTEGSTLDKLGATAKIIKSRNADEIAKIQQQEKDKKGEK